MLLLARTEKPLHDLQARYPKQVRYLTGDVADYDSARRAVRLAVDEWGRVDGLVLNHGTLAPVARVADSSAEGWEKGFRVNFLSCVEFVRNLLLHLEMGRFLLVRERWADCVWMVSKVKEALPQLRRVKGRIVFTSSGAAVHSYASWGAYGAAKAALNHLAMTLSVEEPDVVTIAVRPGAVDTDMQTELREVYHEKMDEKDRERFSKLKKEGGLLKPEQPGNVMARLVLEAGKELSGKFVR